MSNKEISMMAVLKNLIMTSAIVMVPMVGNVAESAGQTLDSRGEKSILAVEDCNARLESMIKDLKKAGQEARNEIGNEVKYREYETQRAQVGIVSALCGQLLILHELLTSTARSALQSIEKFNRNHCEFGYNEETKRSACPMVEKFRRQVQMKFESEIASVREQFGSHKAAAIEGGNIAVGDPEALVLIASGGPDRIVRHDSAQGFTMRYSYKELVVTIKDGFVTHVTSFGR